MTSTKYGLVLSGGGARAAYQVGALKAIAELLPFSTRQNPFPIISGTSAGAINATVVAAYAQHYRVGMRRLENVWANFSCEQIFRTDFASLLRNTGRWAYTLAGGKPNSAMSLLDNQPLAELLDRVIPYPLIDKAIKQGDLDALCVTASSYSSGQSISFFQGTEDHTPWRRHRRCGQVATINRQHLLASSAIPLVFPVTKVGSQFFGDGSMRFLSPLSPAIHLGAEKLLVIGVDPVHANSEQLNHPEGYPSIAEIGGHLLDSVFIDSLDSDLERLKRINETLAKVPKRLRQKAFNLKQVETLVINPSYDLSLVAREYFSALPKILAFFLRRIGIDGQSGDAVLSYLLFEKPFTQRLIELGYTDAMERAQDIKAFFATNG